LNTKMKMLLTTIESIHNCKGFITVKHYNSLTFSLFAVLFYRQIQNTFFDMMPLILSLMK
jgi:hypothetical protein